jgi:hypothetical protein
MESAIRRLNKRIEDLLGQQLESHEIIEKLVANDLDLIDDVMDLKRGAFLTDYIHQVRLRLFPRRQREGNPFSIPVNVGGINYGLGKLTRVALGEKILELLGREESIAEKRKIHERIDALLADRGVKPDDNETTVDQIIAEDELVQLLGGETDAV